MNKDASFFVSLIIVGCAGLIMGALIMSAKIDKKNINEIRQQMIKNNIGEYRINKETGESSFYMFKVESGKVVN